MIGFRMNQRDDRQLCFARRHLAHGINKLRVLLGLGSEIDERAADIVTTVATNCFRLFHSPGCYSLKSIIAQNMAIKLPEQRAAIQYQYLWCSPDFHGWDRN